jgi:hypothetical protein
MNFALRVGSVFDASSRQLVPAHKDEDEEAKSDHVDDQDGVDNTWKASQQ